MPSTWTSHHRLGAHVTSDPIDVDQQTLLPVPNHQDYFVGPHGQVYSKRSGQLRPMRIRQAKDGGRFYVRINEPASGARYELGIRTLLADTFQVRFEEWMKDQLRRDHGL